MYVWKMQAETSFVKVDVNLHICSTNTVVFESQLIVGLILGVKTCDTHQWRKTKKTKKSTQ